MHGAAVPLAERSNQHTDADAFLISDMIDLALFRSLLTENLRSKPMVLFFHENQLSYPWSEQDQDIQLKRDRHYAWMNFSSALVADRVWWNSDYHKSSFVRALPEFLSAFPDHRLLDRVKIIDQKSIVKYIGIDFPDTPIEKPEKITKPKTILWNHRWEYDKGPDDFFSTLISLKEKGIDFNLIVCGEQYSKYPKVFDHAKEQLKDEIIHFGYVDSREEYYSLLKRADLLPVTGIQDFFGISIAEAAWFGAKPILPLRLSYPEIFSPVATFYQEKSELKTLLTKELSTETEATPLNTVRESLNRFHWKEIAENYDVEFEGLMN
jgi:glycosyltransferase involved in cell wall biosynthesis